MLKSDLIKKVTELEATLKTISKSSDLKNDFLKLEKENKVLKNKLEQTKDELEYSEDEVRQKDVIFSALDGFENDFKRMTLAESDLVKEALSKIFNRYIF